jgi:hypothetical protein
MRNAVAVELALETVRQFCETGQLAELVHWEEV